MSEKPQVRIVLKMCRGTVEDVFVDSDDVEITGIMITEDASYAEDRTKEFFVNGGRCGGDFIYIQIGDPIVDKETVEAVVKAAEARFDAEVLEVSTEGH